MKRGTSSTRVSHVSEPNYLLTILPLGSWIWVIKCLLIGLDSTSMSLKYSGMAVFREWKSE
jgi:hypothetical protein